MRLAFQVASGAVALLLTPTLVREVTLPNVPLGAVPSGFEWMQPGLREPGPWEVVQDSEASGGRAVKPLQP